MGTVALTQNGRCDLLASSHDTSTQDPPFMDDLSIPLDSSYLSLWEILPSEFIPNPFRQHPHGVIELAQVAF